MDKLPYLNAECSKSLKVMKIRPARVRVESSSFYVANKYLQYGCGRGAGYPGPGQKIQFHPRKYWLSEENCTNLPSRTKERARLGARPGANDNRWYLRTTSYAAGKFCLPEGPDWRRWEDVDVPT
jgi:hypothetical protein